MIHSQAREDAQRTVGHMCTTHAVSRPFPIFRPTLLSCVLAMATSASANELADSFHGPERFDIESLGTTSESTIDADIHEGDMLLRPKQLRALSDTSSGMRAFGHDRALERWPNGIVPYDFGDGITNTQRGAILEAIQHYHDNTRITFVQSQSGDAYDTRLVFRATGGCASYVGRTDFAEQDLFVENCSSGSVIHELAHAIGLYHEHTRRDRDNYIQVNWDEVTGGKERNFEILTANAQHIGEYDYGSIMHYGEYFFSKTGGKTIEAPDGVTIGQRSGLSSLDIASINYMYATDLVLSVGTAVGKVSTEDGTEIDGLIVDIDVTNNGNLGAHALELVMQLGTAADWLTISDSSGWDCTISGSSLNCQTATLAAGLSSNFVLTVNPNGASEEDLSVRLDSRTLDLELSNNAYNDDTPLNGTAGDEQASSTANNSGNSNSSGSSNNSGNTSNSGNSNSSGNTSDNTPALGAAAKNAVAGSSGPVLLSLVGLILMRRRRKRG